MFVFCFSFLFLDAIDSQAVETHCITEWPHRGAQRLCACWPCRRQSAGAHGSARRQISTTLPNTHGLEFMLNHLPYQVHIFKLLKMKCVHTSTLHKGQKQVEATAPSSEGLHTWNLSQWELWRHRELNPDLDFSGIFWLSPLTFPNRVNNNNSTPF